MHNRNVLHYSNTQPLTYIPNITILVHHVSTPTLTLMLEGE
jgi:hypothetical protein